MNLVDALVLKGLSRVGDDSINKILWFAAAHGLSTLEELSTVGISNLPFKTVPLALRTCLESQDFESARAKVEGDLSRWKAKDIETIVLGSEKYPKQLLGLRNPPPFLFCKGKIDLLQHTSAVAVVGTRQNTDKGELIASKTVEAFAKFGFSIVSGLAMGIDAIAHRAALNYDAPTIAVLVDLVNISPSTNRALADEIIKKGGLWVSENPPNTKLIPAFFAKRDRIQAGLSTAVFAIETSVDGGTMHAVNAALSMRRPVFVPDATMAGYSDLAIKAISGTQHLIADHKATPYTRDSYPRIVFQLEKIASEFNSDIQDRLPL